MKKKRILGYLGLFIVPFAVACSVGTDNAVLYEMTGHLRGSFINALTQNYWTNFKKNVSNPTQNMKDIYASLIKENGVGVNLIGIKIASLKINGQIKKPSNGKGMDVKTRYLYDCQPDKPSDLTKEEKAKIKDPDPTKCNENNKTIRDAIKLKAEFKIAILYKGGKYATAAIPKGTKVAFCATTVYSFNNDILHARIIRLDDPISEKKIC